jgi:hypothetical protein
MSLIPYTIGITTFDRRFTQFKNFITKIREYTETEIIVVVNGPNNSDFDETYRIESLNLFSSFKKILPIYFSEMRGCAKLWNTIIIHSKTDNVLILNDDINFTGNIFVDVEEALKKLNDLILFNNEFSHFLIKKSFAYRINYFDERFLGFGEEDNDMYSRYVRYMNKKVPSFKIKNLKHLVSSIKLDLVDTVGTPEKYSSFNVKYREKKYMFNDHHLGRVQLKKEPKLYPWEQYFQKLKKFV